MQPLILHEALSSVCDRGRSRKIRNERRFQAPSPSCSRRLPNRKGADATAAQSKCELRPHGLDAMTNESGMSDAEWVSAQRKAAQTQA
jgi:hypothetical protein